MRLWSSFMKATATIAVAVQMTAHNDVRPVIIHPPPHEAVPMAVVDRQLLVARVPNHPRKVLDGLQEMAGVRRPLPCRVWSIPMDSLHPPRLPRHSLVPTGRMEEHDNDVPCAVNHPCHVICTMMNNPVHHVGHLLIAATVVVIHPIRP